MATKNENTTLALIKQDISYVKEDVRDIKSTLSSGYVTYKEFEPVRKVVYGLVTLILLGVGGAILGLVFR